MPKAPARSRRLFVPGGSGAIRQMAIDEMELIVDNFAGGGGASTGIALALGREVDIAINHDPDAIAMHTVNHPHTRHYCESVWDVDPLEVTQGRPVGLGWFSPDCFPAGTVILTAQGYRPIEEIKVGDLVFTHRLRWRCVTDVHRSRRPLVSIKGAGHPGLVVSPEHPFLIRERSYRWNNDLRRDVPSLSEPEWLPASQFTSGEYRYSYGNGRRTHKNGGHYWGTPTEFEQLPIPSVGGRGMQSDERLMWLAGRYIADGWTRLTDDRAEVVITCGDNKIGELRDALSRWPRDGARSNFGELAWHERKTETAYQFTTDHRGLVEWLRSEFGHGALQKRIPGWALGMSDDLRRALLSGYVSGDGSMPKCDGNPLVECTTVSRSLAFGLKALAGSLGYSPAVYYNATPNRIIDGRIVNAHPSWSIRWRTIVDQAHRQTVRENGVEWAAIKEQTPISAEADVFNIAVEDDESYIAEGIIVHNCTHHSKARGGKPRKKEIRGLAWVMVKWAALVRPRVLMLENVEEFQDWGPLDENDQPIKERKGETYAAFIACLSTGLAPNHPAWTEIREALGDDFPYRLLEAGLGYVTDGRELRACDYGAPTIRKRFFLVARCDGRPIVWPRQTHGDPKSPAVQAGKLNPWRTAAEIIDWSIPTPSIFERDRPLAEKTMRRIARGIWKFVINNPRPFVIKVNHSTHDTFRGQKIDEPMQTITAKNGWGVVAPTLMPVEAAAFISRQFTKSGAGNGADEPVGTIVAKDKTQLVTAFLAQYHSETASHDARGQTLDRPILTVDTSNRYALVSSHLVKMYGTTTGQPTDEPLHTITAGGFKFGEVRAFLCKYYGSAENGQNVDEPLHTITTKDRFGLVTIHGTDYAIVDIGMRMLEPRELFRAQGFPDDYIIDRGADGKSYPKAAQVARCGNAVPPVFSRALVEANLPELCGSLTAEEASV